MLEQLARYAGVRTRRPATATFADMFAARLGSLSPEAHRLLETLAICGRPMASDVVCDASRVAGERQSLIATLRASRFIRSSGSSGWIETYHDRIRECSPRPSLLTPAKSTAAWWRCWSSGSDDCEALFEHYHGAGDTEHAAIQAGRAGDKSGTALAFDRAASLHQHALSWDLGPFRERGGKDLRARERRPSDRGRCEAYMQAAAGADDLQRVELQRRGAEQFLIGGHIDRGRDLIRTMLADLGMSVPRSPRAALLPLLWRRARLRWRGLHFTSRRPTRSTPTPPARGRLLVRGDGIVARGHDQRGRDQRTPSARGARCRGALPSRARDGARVDGEGGLSERSSARAGGSSSSRKNWRRASAT